MIAIELDPTTAIRVRELCRRRAADMRASAASTKLRMSERAMTLAEAGQLTEFADQLDRALTAEAGRPTDDPRYQSGAH